MSSAQQRTLRWREVRLSEHKRKFALEVVFQLFAFINSEKWKTWALKCRDGIFLFYWNIPRGNFFFIFKKDWMEKIRRMLGKGTKMGDHGGWKRWSDERDKAVHEIRKKDGNDGCIKSLDFNVATHPGYKFSLPRCSIISIHLQIFKMENFQCKHHV